MKKDSVDKRSDFDLPNLKDQKILITGGLGFIGSNLARKCLELGAKVTVFDCLDPRSGGNLYNIQEIRHRIEICFHDILNFDQITEHIVDKDIIFNCAASTSHSFSMREPWLDQDVNSRGMINLLEAIRRFSPDIKFVHIGTSTQLGKLHYQPADEFHPEFPTDIYSANKSVSEKYALIYATAYNLNLCVIRLANVFGPRASIHSPEFTFNNYFIGLALQNKTITVFGDGKQLRNVLFVDDAVNALILASQSDKTNGETFFAVSDTHYSVKDIAEETCKIMGGSVHLIDWPKEREAIEIGDAVISNEKIKKALGWVPKVGLEYGLKLTYDYYKDKLEEYLK